MLFKPTIVASLSGSLGGITASRNRFGAYLRERVLPVNPNSTAQVAVRAHFTTLAIRWGTLTTIQREAWDTYAENVPVINPIGDSITLTGFNMYIRSNVPRLVAGLAIVDDGPTVFTLAELTLPTLLIVVVAGLQQVLVAYDNTDPWAIADGGALLVSASRERSPSVVFFKGPYRFVGSELGNTTTPPTSPVSLVTPFTGTVGNQASAFIRATDADGRLSSEIELSVAIT